MTLCVASQSCISTSSPNYSFNIGNSLCVIHIIVVLDCLQSTGYIYFLACLQYWCCTWDCSQHFCSHYYRSNDRSNNIIIDSNSCFGFSSYRPCQQCWINQRRNNMFLTCNIYILCAVTDKFCYSVDYGIFLNLALLNDAGYLNIQVFYMWINNICELSILNHMLCYAQFKWIRTVDEYLVILAVCLSSSRYSRFALQVVINSHGYISLTCMYRCYIQFVLTTLGQLAQLDTCTPINFCPISTWLAIFNQVQSNDKLATCFQCELAYIVASLSEGLTIPFISTAELSCKLYIYILALRLT